MRKLTAVTGLLLACGLFVACGTESADDPAATSPTMQDESSAPPEGESGDPNEPLCADVWVDGEVLAKSYAGCHDAEESRWVEAHVLRCSSDQRIVTFADSFYAVPGREIVAVDGSLAEDPDYTQMVAACTA